MSSHVHVLRVGLVSVFLASLAHTAAAQVGTLSGVVRDEDERPVKGAIVVCENPEAAPSTFKTTTDDKGQFSMIGLRASRGRAGLWRCTFTATGFLTAGGDATPSAFGKPSPLSVVLRKAGSGGVTPGLTVAAAKDLQADLQAADQLFNARQWDAAIQKYRAILARAPALTVVNLQIAECYRAKKEYDNAIAALNELLKADPANDKAKIGIGMANLEKGDLKAAEETLTTAAGSASAGKEVFYDLGEVKFTKGESDEAAKWYQKAVDADPSWGAPLYKLALVRLNKGDKDGALKLFEKVIAVDPTSTEAAQAKAVIGEFKK
jgi:predicted Zn-dependent protease